MEIEIEQIREKLIAKLKTNGWYNSVRLFINSSEFDTLITTLHKEVELGKRFTPPIKDIFTALECTSFEDTKVVILGQDPYPQLDTADGIAFSCSKKGKAEKSLQYIFKALNGTQWDSLDPDLRRWCKQGVLPLNTAFTVQIGNIGSHYEIWKPFTSQLLDYINCNLDCICILMGKKAEQWEHFLNNQKIFKVPHPASAAYKGGVWDDKNVFIEVNNELQKRGKSQIMW